MSTEYEMMLIFDRREEVFRKSLERIKANFTTLGVTLIAEEDMEVRKLAYEINKNTEGRYYLFTFSCETANVLKINQDIRLDEGILRHMVVKKSGEAHGN